MKIEWNNIKDKDIEIPINTDVLITDSHEVFVGFYDSMLEWRMADQELCDDLSFNVTHWMEFPNPPCN
jgi:hypothetical protein